MTPPVVLLPPGRYVQFDQSGGFLYDASVTLPVEVLDFDAALAQARPIADDFDAKGWTRCRTRLDQITQAESGAASVGGRFERAGTWLLCDKSDHTISVLIRDFDELPSAPLVPVLPGRAEEPGSDARYILEVFLQVEDLMLSDEAQALRDARRQAVGGDGSDPLPLRLWLDDPNWRPANWHGTLIP